MRKIKFKAKRLDNDGWVEGYYVKKTTHKQTPKGDVVEDGEEHLIFGMSKEDVQSYWYEVDPSTVCQFTGLKDCDGKEIWEGDIVRDNYDLLCVDNFYEVVYIEEGAFVFKSLDKVDNYEPFVNLFEAYVVGNKFDRKEGEK